MLKLNAKHRGIKSYGNVRIRTGGYRVKEIICPKCGKQMTNLGNLDGEMFFSNPPKINHVWVCYDCKCKKTIRTQFKTLAMSEISAIVKKYEEV